MNKTKVLFMIHSLNIGGTEKSLLNLINILPANYDISILLLTKSGGFLGEVPKNIKLFEIENSAEIINFIQTPPILSISKFFKQKNFKKGFLTLFNYLLYKVNGDYSYNFKSIDNMVPDLSESFDIAIAFAGPYDFISHFISKKVKAFKKIQWIHFDISKIGFNKSTSNKLYSNFDEIKVVSEDVKKQFLKVLPNLESKVQVLHNVISDKHLKQLSKEKVVYNDSYEGTRIVTVGRLSKEKGHELFIPAMKKLVDENYDIKWYLVGDGNYRADLEKMISEYTLKEHIVFVGTQINPYTYIDQASIYLQPSYYEGHCVTILEAKVFNKPIITTNFSGASDEITSGKNGLIVDTSTEGLYSGMKLLLNDDKLLNTFKKNLEESNLKKRAIEFKF